MPLLFVFGLIVWWIAARRAKRAKKQREKVLLNSFSFHPEKNYDAAFASPKQMADADLFNDKGIIAGKVPGTEKYVYFPEKIRGHVGVLGGTGLGKSSYLQTIQTTYPYSMILFDPTGEHASATGDYRSKLGPVYHFNPHRKLVKHISRKLKPVRLNPLGPHWLDPRLPSFDTRADDLAASQVGKVEGNNRYFYDTPQGWLATIMVCNALYGRPEERNLPYIVRNIVNGNLKEYARRIASITKDPNLRARLQQILEDTNIRSRDECISTLRTETRWTLNSVMGEAFSAADITFKPFQHRVQTLYITIPIQSETLGPSNKFALASILGELFDGEPGDVPVLVVMDEAGAYARDLAALARAFATGRKHRVSLLASFTSANEMQGVLKEDFDSVFNNMGMHVFLDAYNTFDSDLVCRLLGDTDVMVANKTVNHPSDFNIPPFTGNDPNMRITNIPTERGMRDLKVSQNYTTQKRPLMTAAELRKMPITSVLVWMRELGLPMLLDHVPFFKTKFKKRVKTGPFFRGKK